MIRVADTLISNTFDTFAWFGRRTQRKLNVEMLSQRVRRVPLASNSIDSRTDSSPHRQSLLGKPRTAYDRALSRTRDRIAFVLLVVQVLLSAVVLGLSVYARHVLGAAAALLSVVCGAGSAVVLFNVPLNALGTLPARRRRPAMCLLAVTTVLLFYIILLAIVRFLAADVYVTGFPDSCL